VAADLLSQAEHGTGDERALLVTPSEALAESVQREVDEQMRTLSRGAAIRKVMTAGGMLLVVVPDLEQGAELCNRFAPEHLELLVRDPKALLKRIHAAGAVFLGPWTPESAGDFVAGPSHVLPTGGAAAMFSGLTVGDFMRRSSVVAFSRADLRETLPTIEAFGRVEGLDGHARSASLRFKAPGRAGRGKAQPS
jgi:histidinol dehydrogenase